MLETVFYIVLALAWARVGAKKIHSSLQNSTIPAFQIVFWYSNCNIKMVYFGSLEKEKMPKGRELWHVWALTIDKPQPFNTWVPSSFLPQILARVYRQITDLT